jgi:hypothetical protein
MYFLILGFNNKGYSAVYHELARQREIANLKRFQDGIYLLISD